jgi:hypothetical protein
MNRQRHSKSAVTQTGKADEVAREELMARAMTGPFLPNALSLHSFARCSIDEEVSLGQVIEALAKNASSINAGKMHDVEALLLCQATTLNVMFAELCRRSVANLNGGQFETGERYMRLALRAQNQSRATLESLSAVKNPPVVYAKQANIAHGPQQVNNSPSPATRRGENEKTPNRLLETGNEQPLDTGTKDTAGAGHSQMEAVGALHGSKKPRG